MPTSQEREGAIQASQPAFTYASPDQLRFDETNPRFGGILQGRTQDGIRDYLMGRPHYASELVDSLLENGFIPYEPLVVRREDNHFVVLEGNRRLAAVKHILANLDTYRTKGKAESLTSIPILVFPPSDARVKRAAERIFLGVHHLFGYREWPPLSKAKFLHQHIKSADDLQRAVKELGIAKAEIQRYLVPYRVLLRTSSDIPQGQDFWVLGEALSRNGIRKYIQLDIDRKTLGVQGLEKRKFSYLLRFLYGKYDRKKKKRDPATAAITDTRQLKDLARALASEVAAGGLEAEMPLDIALVLVETEVESLKRFNRLLAQLDKLIKDSLRVSRRQKGGKELLATFAEFKKAAQTYIKNAESNL